MNIFLIHDEQYVINLIYIHDEQFCKYMMSIFKYTPNVFFEVRYKPFYTQRTSLNKQGGHR